jgi:putative phage-type endonuclease
MPFEIIECEQGSAEWHQARCGVVTASRFADVMAKGEGKTRAKYMRELAGEIITGQPAETYSNAAMERGKEMEAAARAAYEFQSGHMVRQIGFARNGRSGASPDGIITIGRATRALEIKTKLPHLLIECILRGTLPPEHRAQVQGALWILDSDVADFVAYWPGMPLFTVEVFRDGVFLGELSREIARFNDELDAMVETIKRYGGQQ